MRTSPRLSRNSNALSPRGKFQRALRPGTEAFDRLSEFVRSYTDGVEAKGMRQLFDREAPRAIRVLVGERPADTAGGSAQKGAGRDLREAFETARLLFLGMSYRLTPPRRVVFFGSMIAFVFGIVGLDWSIDEGRVRLDGSPFFFVAGFLGITFLLALELVERVLVRDELQVARQLQHELLPARPPDIPGYEISQAWGTANEIGGDYFHFAPLSDGRWAIAIGDASGHGMAAGLLMALSDATLRTALDFTPDPLRVVEALNRRLVHTGDRRSFFSVFLAALELKTGVLEHVGAAHPFPLLRRADGSIEELGRGGYPLGVTEDLELRVERASIAPGETLVLYTDGLPEALDGHGEPFGFDRLHALVRQGGAPEEVRDRILSAHGKHRGEEALADDWTLVVVRRGA